MTKNLPARNLKMGGWGRMLKAEYGHEGEDLGGMSGER